jgi:predicted DNA-binding protein YlxM (UPF0122 family)
MLPCKGFFLDGRDSMTIEKTMRVNLLYDFYGDLLTEKQRRIVEMYYVEDLSLSEIAEQVDASRQAVYDVLRRAVQQLEDYESKLQLVARHGEKRALAGQLLAALDQSVLPEADKRRMTRMIRELVDG